MMSCPMCGSNDVRVSVYMNLACERTDCREVICSGCGLKMWGMTRLDAIKKWNRRAPCWNQRRQKGIWGFFGINFV